MSLEDTDPELQALEEWVSKYRTGHERQLRRRRIVVEGRKRQRELRRAQTTETVPLDIWSTYEDLGQFEINSDALASALATILQRASGVSAGVRPNAATRAKLRRQSLQLRASLDPAARRIIATLRTSLNEWLSVVALAELYAPWTREKTIAVVTQWPSHLVLPMLAAPVVQLQIEECRAGRSAADAADRERLRIAFGRLASTPNTRGRRAERTITPEEAQQAVRLYPDLRSRLKQLKAEFDLPNQRDIEAGSAVQQLLVNLLVPLAPEPRRVVEKWQRRIARQKPSASAEVLLAAKFSTSLPQIRRALRK